MRYYISWKTTGYYRKDSLKLAARCPVSGCWPSCLLSDGPYCHGWLLDDKRCGCGTGYHGEEWPLASRWANEQAQCYANGNWQRISNVISCYIWPPCVADADIIFCPTATVYSFFLSFLLSSPTLSRRRLDIYHTSTHGVALVGI